MRIALLVLVTWTLLWSSGGVRSGSDAGGSKVGVMGDGTPAPPPKP